MSITHSDCQNIKPYTNANSWVAGKKIFGFPQSYCGGSSPVPKNTVITAISYSRRLYPVNYNQPVHGWIEPWLVPAKSAKIRSIYGQL